VDTRVNAMTEGHVECQFGQLTIDRQTIPVRARIGNKRETILAGLHHVAAGSLKQRPDWRVAIKEELDGRDACATNSAVAGRIAWVSWRALREC
jgi:hypothetical protein